MSGSLHPERLFCMLIPISSGIPIWYSFITAHFPVPVSTCETFYVFEAVTFQLLTLCLDSILIFQGKSSEISILNPKLH